jgi:DNA invertase Pin-like site-specific DNA recombinase
MTEQEGVLADVWRSGGRVFSLGDGGEVLEDDPDDPMRTAIRQMRGVFAQLERGLIRQRMTKGKREKAAQGGYVGGAPAFGFVAVGGALVKNSDEQRALVRMRELRAQGQSLRAIIEVLEDEGHVPKRGRWHPTTVARYLGPETNG